MLLLENFSWGIFPLTNYLDHFQQYFSFIGGGNRRKLHDLSQVADKLYHIKLYRVHLAMSGIQTHNFRDDNL